MAASVLDVAFAEDAPQALNIVNPQRPLWVKIMSSIRNAVLEKKLASLTSDDLMVVPFVDWVAQLEKRADNATPEDLANIVCDCYDGPYMFASHRTSACDQMK